MGFDGFASLRRRRAKTTLASRPLKGSEGAGMGWDCAPPAPPEMLAVPPMPANPSPPALPAMPAMPMKSPQPAMPTNPPPPVPTDPPPPPPVTVTPQEPAEVAMENERDHELEHEHEHLVPGAAALTTIVSMEEGEEDSGFEGNPTTNADAKSVNTRAREQEEEEEVRAKTPSSCEDAATLVSSAEPEFVPLATTLPDAKLNFMEQLSFSQRGSVMLGGRKAVTKKQARMSVRPRVRQPPTVVESPSTNNNNNTLSAETEKESLKVRSMYEAGSETDWRDGRSMGDSDTMIREEEADDDNIFNVQLRPRPKTANHPAKRDSLVRREHEMAGGIEDWENVSGGDVDRYGFIIKKTQPDDERCGTPEPRPPQRVSTVLQLASEAPRTKRGFGRQFSTSTTKSSQLTPDRKLSAPSIKTQASSSSQRSQSKGALRSLANRLPGNQDRRWMDEASDMLTLPPGLSDIAESEEGSVVTEANKKREWSRSEKWRRMAKVVTAGPDGEGMEFEFDVSNSKLVDRTWKGIPDRWRATAWYCFLSASAKKVDGSPSDAALVDAFGRLIGQSSADDVQIDMDVPRTINSHIMFRKRYRGGQRLLFRVLHCLTLFFPETGYVQGMASLAATLLCYYDEERTFIMCVRMWTLRGLDKLYAYGFGGLMAALEEFQVDWMRGHDVSRQLVSLHHPPIPCIPVFG